LAENGLTLMMVLFDFLSKRVTPLQLRPCPAWMYTGENDAMRPECGSGSDLDPTVLAGMLSKLSIDSSLNDFTTPSPGQCTPLCLDQTTMLLPLKELPTLDDIDVIVRQMGDQSHGVHSPRMGAIDSRRGADVTSGPGKGKEKVAPYGSASKARSWLASSNIETSSEEAAPVERKMRLTHSDRSSVDGLPLPEQQAPKKAAAS
jgi:hypothetical protein